MSPPVLCRMVMYLTMKRLLRLLFFKPLSVTKRFRHSVFCGVMEKRSFLIGVAGFLNVIFNAVTMAKFHSAQLSLFQSRAVTSMIHYHDKAEPQVKERLAKFGGFSLHP